MTVETKGIGTRTAAAKPTRKTTASTAELSRQEREEWIASVDIANLDTQGFPKIDPMPGMEQRWVRSKIGNEMDTRNLAQSEREGYRPRSAESLTSRSYDLRITTGDYAGYIGVHDAILMHRPIEIGDKFRAIEKQKVLDLKRAVNSMDFRETPQGADPALMRNEPSELHSTVEKGSRVVEIPD